MKIPLLALLLTATVASASEWTSLTGIDDQIEIPAGQTALMVSVSRPSYLAVNRPENHCQHLRVRPYHPSYQIEIARQNKSTHEVEVGWRHPFAISGPCTVRLGTAAVVTFRMIGGDDAKK